MPISTYFKVLIELILIYIPTWYTVLYTTVIIYCEEEKKKIDKLKKSLI